jgi:hypothetical protein
MITFTETFTFNTAADLRDWLNQFWVTDLSTVYFGDDKDSAQTLTIKYENEQLTDGSEVRNIIIL